MADYGASTAVISGTDNAGTTRIASELPDDLEIEKELERELSGFRDAIDSPRALLIARNAALTILEVEKKVDEKAVFLLLADKEYRDGIVNRLVSETPDYWDEVWQQSWHKDAEPLYSKLQQRITRRRSLINFWTREWETLPADQISHVLVALETLAK